MNADLFGGLVLLAALAVFGRLMFVIGRDRATDPAALIGAQTSQVRVLRTVGMQLLDLAGSGTLPREAARQLRVMASRVHDAASTHAAAVEALRLHVLHDSLDRPGAHLGQFVSARVADSSERIDRVRRESEARDYVMRPDVMRDVRAHDAGEGPSRG